MTLKDIGLRIRQARQKKGFTLSAIAEKIGVSESTFSRYENGHVDTIRNEKLEQIALILGVSPGWIMGWESDALGGPSSWKAIPIYGTISAGEPIMAQENVEGYEYVDVDRPEDHFFLRVKGDSMTGARILDGDLALIKKHTYVENGDIVAVLIDGIDATLKRMKKTDEGLWFLPENPAYKPTFVSLDEIEKDPGYVQILGVLVKLVVNYK